MFSLSCGQKTLDLSKPAIMGIVNVTPDSFSDGGRLYTNSQVNISKTLRTVENMLLEGADIIDIGGKVVVMMMMIFSRNHNIYWCSCLKTT